MTNRFQKQTPAANVKTLILPLKRKWFEQVKSGEKVEEYRLRNAYWSRRLSGKTFDRIILTLGYPKKGCSDRRIELPWRGCVEKNVISEEWNNQPMDVFAIKLN
jgi:hypothetical protein